MVTTTTGAPAAPLARVLVTVSGDSVKPGRTAITDDQGRFAFRDLPPGKMTIVAARPPYVKTAFGAKRPGRPGTPINLAAGQQITDLTIALARGAAITGMVRHPGGDPAPGIQIVATPLDVQVDRVGTSAVTDDRGVYRLFGLSPGRYLVKASASERNNTVFTQVSDAEMEDILARLRRRSSLGTPAGSSSSGTPHTTTSVHSATYGYAPIYYPSTPDPDQAEPLTLAEGDERTAVDLDLQLVRTATIEGRVSMAGDTAPNATQVSLVRLGLRGRATDALIMPATARVDGSGAFRFANMLPGKYRLTARATTITPVAAAGANAPVSARSTGVFWALTDVTIGDDDLRGITLALQPELKVTGRVVFNSRTLTPPQNVALRLTELGAAPAFTRLGSARADGTFEVNGLVPGIYTVTSPLSDAGWWLSSVAIEGRDVLDFPLEMGAGDVRDAVATFTDQRTELSGTLQTAANVPAPEYFVVVFSSDRTFWRPPSRRVQFTRPSSDGRFMLRDLPPGGYLIAALTDMEPSDLGDPSFIERLVPVALKLHLDPGEKKTQDLTLAK